MIPELPHFDRPEFALPTPIFRPEDFGGVADGKTLCTKAIQQALDAAEETGGSVLLEKGIYLSGCLFLRSNLTLFIRRGSKLLASGNLSDYPENVHENRYAGEDHMNLAFLFAENCHDLVFTGGGEIDGHALAFHNDSNIYAPRPMMVRMLACKNIIIEHLFCHNAAAWTFAFLGCSDLIARSLTLRSLVNLNGDGLDFDGCRRVLAEDCVFDQSDDSICLQSNGQGQQDTEDVTIRRCHMRSYTGGVRIGMKSVGNIRRVLVEDCDFDHIWREGIKIESSEGGIIEDLIFRRLYMQDVCRPFYYICNNLIVSKGIGKIPPFGAVRRVLAEDVKIRDSQEMMLAHFYTWGSQHCVMGEPKFSGIRVDAPASAKMQDITFRNVDYLVYGGVKENEIPKEYPVVEDRRQFAGFCSDNYYPDWSRTTHMDLRNIDGLTLENVRFSLRHADARPAILVEDCALSAPMDAVLQEADLTWVPKNTSEKEKES